MAYCGKPVTVYVNPVTGKEVKKPCGDTYDSEKVICDRCRAALEKQYPQGWRYYPGDVCEHGKYTGGCGVDLMCFQCEMGE